jgi:hypothetical protein
MVRVNSFGFIYHMDINNFYVLCFVCFALCVGEVLFWATLWVASSGGLHELSRQKIAMKYRQQQRNG